MAIKLYFRIYHLNIKTGKKLIEKAKRVSISTLQGFCALHEINTIGTTVNDIIKSLVKDGIINDNLDIENEKFGKALLTEELELYQKAKLVELIVEPISVLTLEDCDKTTPCQRCASNKRQMWTHSSEYF